MATLFRSVYWATQLGAFLFPGAAPTDPEFGYDLPMIGGIRLNQVHLASLNLMLLFSGYQRALTRVTG